MNLVGNAAIAVMGIAGAGVNPMSYAALALGGINSGYETFKQGHFLTGTIWKLESGVREGRVTAADNLKSNMAGSDPYNYFEAQDTLLAYHNTCSRLQLIAYVEKSVELVRYTPDPAESFLTHSTVLRLSQELYKLVNDKDGQYSRIVLKNLYSSHLITQP